MTNWISSGGCYNAMRWSHDGAGAGARDWAAAVDADLGEYPKTIELILATSWDSDDMDTISGDFELQFRNLTDAGAWTVMGAATEVAWGTGTDLVNGNAIVAAEELGVNNCSGKGPSHLDGVEREGANSVTMSSIASKVFFDLHWAIDLSGATDAKEYEFRVVETGTSNVYATLAGTVVAGATGTISGVSKDKDGNDLGSCFVTVHQKVEGGGPPHLYDCKQATTSHATTGAYSFSDLLKSKEFFVYFTKENAPHVMDATDDVHVPV